MLILVPIGAYKRSLAVLVLGFYICSSVSIGLRLDGSAFPFLLGRIDVIVCAIVVRGVCFLEQLVVRLRLPIERYC